MYLKDFIKQLQELYDSYDAEYHKIMGEPEIMIDTFKPAPDGKYRFEYGGFSNHIKIEKTSDGVYDVIPHFHE